MFSPTYHFPPLQLRAQVSKTANHMWSKSELPHAVTFVLMVACSVFVSVAAVAVGVGVGGIVTTE